MQDSLPAGWLAFAGRELNPLDRYERFPSCYISSPFPEFILTLDGAEPERHVETIRKGKTVETRRYRWIAAVPLRDGKDAALVNWIAFEILDRHGAIKYSIAWVTSLPVSKATVANIAAAGRSRWKIENEKSRL
jgi:hypothetical protein